MNKVLSGVSYNKILIGLSTGALLLAGGSLFEVTRQYQTSVKWNTHQSNQQTMADIEADVLFDGYGLSRQAKVDFDTLVDQIYDRDTQDFKVPVTQSYQTDLRDLVMQIDPLTRENYWGLYQEINAKLEIQLAYNDLFKDGSFETFKDHITPKHILNTNDTYFEYINALYIFSYGEDQFAVRIYNLQQKLAQEVASFNELLLTLESWMFQQPENNLLYPKANLYPIDLENFFNQISGLQYNWPILNNPLHIAQLLEPFAKDNIERKTTYDTYIIDLESRQKAFDDLQKTIEELDKQVLENRRRRQEEARRRQETSNRQENETSTPEIEPIEEPITPESSQEESIADSSQDESSEESMDESTGEESIIEEESTPPETIIEDESTPPETIIEEPISIPEEMIDAIIQDGDIQDAQSE